MCYTPKNSDAIMKHIGLIGLGRQMKLELIPAIANCSNLFRVMALCDINSHRLQQVHSAYPKAEPFRSYELMLKTQKLDAVIVCVPHYVYYPIVEMALRKGTAVFKEKPFALNSNETKLTLNLWEKTLTPIYTVGKRQFYGSYGWAKDHLSSLGEVYQYSARRAISSGTLYRGWRSHKDQAGGGALIDLGYHFLHIIVDYFGLPKDIAMWASSSGKPGYHYEVEDAVSLLLHHMNSLHGTLMLNCLAGMSEESFEIIGTEARMLIRRDRVVIYTKNGIQKNKSFETDSVLANSMALKEFYKADQATIQENINRNVAVMDMTDAAYKSMKRGSW